jgi:hypothetical protein
MLLLVEIFLNQKNIGKFLLFFFFTKNYLYQKYNVNFLSFIIIITPL